MRSHDADRRPALHCLQLAARNSSIIAKGAEHLVGLQAGQTGEALYILRLDLAVAAFNRLK